MPAASDIQRMFGSIAWRYDVLNRVLSLGTDKTWRRRTCDALRLRPGELAADLCCGTGDLALAVAERGLTVVAADFTREMLDIAGRKGVARLAEADCLRLPFRTESFDVATVAFGVRNLASLEGGLSEILRVLKPGGRVGILEFATPTGPVFRRLYHVYLRWFVPLTGALLSGRRAAYEYLSSSIQDFPDQPRMKELMRGAGYESVTHVDLARGIAALYIGYRPS